MHSIYLTTTLSSVTVIILITLFSRFHTTYGNSIGAPVSICDTMVPSHQESASRSPLPYNINVDRTFVRGESTITITVKSTDESKYKFKGVLFIMKRPGGSGKAEAFGKFDPADNSNDLKAIDCFRKKATGITHTNGEEKTSLTFKWIAPNISHGEYELHGTIVRDYNYFWADYIYPTKIEVSGDAPESAAGTISNQFLFIKCLLVAVIVLLYSA